MAGAFILRTLGTEASAAAGSRLGFRSWAAGRREAGKFSGRKILNSLRMLPTMGHEGAKNKEFFFTKAIDLVKRNKINDL